MRINKTGKLIVTSLLLAVGIVLPFFILQIPAIGNMLCPMHLPVLICGFVCGGPYGLLLGIVLPLFRSMLFGMPALVPNAVCMSFELAAYGAVSGMLYEKLMGKKGAIYISLISAMLSGRVIWGIVSWCVYGLLGNSFTWHIFAMQAFVNAVPGILLQLILIPAIVTALKFAGFSRFKANHQKLEMKTKCMERFAPATAAIDKLLKNSDKETIIIAIDGKCGSGKTTLGYYLEGIYDCNLFHMDDFFLRTEQRTPERMREVGGNVDYERFKSEVLDRIQAGDMTRYQKFDCQMMQLEETIQTIPFKRLNIIEGSYSQHPYFGDVYDLKIFMEISEKQQLENILKRNGEEKLKRFKNEWIPKENAYFTKFQIKKDCVIINW